MNKINKWCHGETTPIPNIYREALTEVGHMELPTAVETLMDYIAEYWVEGEKDTWNQFQSQANRTTNHLEAPPLSPYSKLLITGSCEYEKGQGEEQSHYCPGYSDVKTTPYDGTKRDKLTKMTKVFCSHCQQEDTVCQQLFCPPEELIVNVTLTLLTSFCEDIQENFPACYREFCGSKLTKRHVRSVDSGYPQPSNLNSQYECQASLPWSGVAGMDKWCKANCVNGNDVAVCTEQFCDCSQKPVTTTTTSSSRDRPAPCTEWEANSIYSGTAGMDSWCQSVCSGGRCPQTHCQCKVTTTTAQPTTTSTTSATTTSTEIPTTTTNTEATTEPSSTSTTTSKEMSTTDNIFTRYSTTTRTTSTTTDNNITQYSTTTKSKTNTDLPTNKTNRESTTESSSTSTTTSVKMSTTDNIITQYSTTTQSTTSTDLPTTKTNIMTTTYPLVGSTSTKITTSIKPITTNDIMTTEPSTISYSNATASNTGIPTTQSSSSTASTEIPITTTKRVSTTKPSLTSTASTASTEIPITTTKRVSTTKPSLTSTASTASTEIPITTTKRVTTTKPSLTSTASTTSTEIPTTTTKRVTTTQPSTSRTSSTRTESPTTRTYSVTKAKPSTASTTSKITSTEKPTTTTNLETTTESSTAITNTALTRSQDTTSTSLSDSTLSPTEPSSMTSTVSMSTTVPELGNVTDEDSLNIIDEIVCDHAKVQGHNTIIKRFCQGHSQAAVEKRGYSEDIVGQVLTFAPKISCSLTDGTPRTDACNNMFCGETSLSQRMVQSVLCNVCQTLMVNGGQTCSNVYC